MPNPTQSPAETKVQVPNPVPMMLPPGAEWQRDDGYRFRFTTGAKLTSEGLYMTVGDYERMYPRPAPITYSERFCPVNPREIDWRSVSPAAAVSDRLFETGDEVEITEEERSLWRGRRGVVVDFDRRLQAFNVDCGAHGKAPIYAKALRLIRRAPTEAARTGEEQPLKVGHRVTGIGSSCGRKPGIVVTGKISCFEGKERAHVVEDGDGWATLCDRASLRPLPPATAGGEQTNGRRECRPDAFICGVHGGAPCPKPKPCPDCKRESGHSLTCPEFDNWIRNGRPLSPSPADAEAMRLHEEALKPFKAEELRAAALTAFVDARRDLYHGDAEYDDAIDAWSKGHHNPEVAGPGGPAYVNRAWPEDAYLDAESCEP